MQGMGWVQKGVRFTGGAAAAAGMCPSPEVMVSVAKLTLRISTCNESVRKGECTLCGRDARDKNPLPFPPKLGTPVPVGSVLTPCDQEC